MEHIIAVDDTLHNIKTNLEKNGYKTVELSTADFRNVDAYVVDKNNEDLVKRKNFIGDERVIAAGDEDFGTVLTILKKNL